MTPITNAPVNEQSQHCQSQTTGTHNYHKLSSAQQSRLSSLAKQVGTALYRLTQWSTTLCSSTDAVRTSITDRGRKQVTQPRERYFDALIPEQWHDKYHQVTLWENSDQMMQWVIFVCLVVNFFSGSFATTL